VAVSSFVPKSHTPFQWEPQIGYEEILEKQQLLREELKKKRLNFKWQDAPLSVLEGVFARGDRRLGRLLLKARELGCRFDGWGDHFSFATWIEAFRAAGIDPFFYLRRRDDAETLPWDHLDYGVTKDFLRAEREKALGGVPTGDCRDGRCRGCGVCDFGQVRMRLTLPDAGATQGEGAAGHREEPPGREPEQGETGPARIRLRFEKSGAMRFLSHLELITLFTRAVAKARIPVRFSQGFHPHPKFSFATALSVGVESRAEYFDMEIAAGFGAPRAAEELNRVLPAGIRILEAAEVGLKSPSLSVLMAGVRYRVTLPEGAGVDLPALAARFLSLESSPFRREKKGKTVELDLRRELVSLTASASALEMVVGRGKPLEFTAAITSLPPETLAAARIEKLEVIFKSEA
jgi:radical SAM-linked protein